MALQTIVLAFVGMLIIVAAMAIGVMFGRRPITGSCGGLSASGLAECEICGGDPARCKAASETTDDGRSDRWYRAD